MGTAGMESAADIAAMRARLFLHLDSTHAAATAFSRVLSHYIGVANGPDDDDDVWDYHFPTAQPTQLLLQNGGGGTGDGVEDKTGGDTESPRRVLSFGERAGVTTRRA